MPRGGYRPGAGRKVGSFTKRTRQIAETSLKQGISPLEVMLNAMRAAYDDGDMKEAVVYADKAAPYCHARLSAVNQTSEIQAELVVIDEFGESILDS